MLAAFYILSTVLFLDASNPQKDLSELTRIAGLKGGAYVAARNQFIQSRTEPVDIDKAIEKGWPEGLLALIINARISEPNLFRVYDDSESQVYPAHNGDLRWRPPDVWDRSKGVNVCGVIYQIEKIWKGGVWPEELLAQTAHRLARGGSIVGPAKLWHRVFRGTANLRLKTYSAKAIAMNSNDDAVINTVKEALAEKGMPEGIKKMIISGLYQSKSKHTTMILTNTFENWKSNPDIANFGLATIGRQADPNVKAFLYDIILDTSQPDYLRSAAFYGMSQNPELQDVPYLRQGIKSSLIRSYKERTFFVLSKYPYNLVREIVHNAIVTTEDPNVLRICIDIIDISVANDDDLLLLSTISENQKVPESHRKMAKAVIEKIKQKKEEKIQKMNR